ncbi:MAG: Lrp/AsnC ligand binding domain-containing protein [Thermoproteota archaeon]|nr:Lrp/AsnC ligand binding domain-containing protein [Candidatus Brockarchaeota archaeon]
MAHAYVLMNVEIGTENDVLNKLKETPGVVESWIVFGVYDIITKVEAENSEKLKEFIGRYIRKIEGVRNTLTLMPIEGFSK